MKNRISKSFCPFGASVGSTQYLNRSNWIVWFKIVIASMAIIDYVVIVVAAFLPFLIFFLFIILDVSDTLGYLLS